MIKTFRTALFATALCLACSNIALADGNAFTPLNFDDASYSAPAAKTSAKTTTPANTVKAQDLVGNDDMQNAILKLDNAQVDVRNELLNVKAKYSEVDAQFQAVKAERKALHKQVRSIEKRINKIEKQKEDIRRNML